MNMSVETTRIDRFAFSIGLVSLLLASCSSGGSRPGHRLELKVDVPVTLSAHDQSVVATYALINHGPPAEACITFSKGFDLWTAAGVKQNLDLRDHPSCIGTVVLERDKPLEWTVTVPTRGIRGDGRLSAWVKLSLMECPECGVMTIRAPDVSLSLNRED
jgi:hypothetical protein